MEKWSSTISILVFGLVMTSLTACLPGFNEEDNCDNTCQYANDGECDDGGPGSSYSLCDCGTDCADCGERSESDCDGSSSSSSSSGSSSSGSSSSGGSSSSSSGSSSGGSSSGGSSSSSSSGGGTFTGANLTGGSYYFPSVNNCDVPGFSINGSQALITVLYNLDSGSGPMDPTGLHTEGTIEFSDGNTINAEGNVYDVAPNSFGLRYCLIFGSTSSANIEYRLYRGNTPLSNTRNITVYKPSGGN